MVKTIKPDTFYVHKDWGFVIPIEEPCNDRVQVANFGWSHHPNNMISTSSTLVELADLTKVVFDD